MALIVFQIKLDGLIGKLNPNWAYNQSFRRYFQMDYYDDLNFQFWWLHGFQKVVGNPNGTSLNCALTS